MLDSSSKKNWKMDIFDSALNQSLHLSEGIWTIDLWRTPVSNQAGCHYHYSTKRTKTPAPEGPLGLTRAPATQSTPLYCISSMTSADSPAFMPPLCNHLVAKLTKRSRIALMKTNVQTWLAPIWPFKSLPMPFFLLKMLLLSITVIRLIPVRYLTAREGDSSAPALLRSARFSW